VREGEKLYQIVDTDNSNRAEKPKSPESPSHDSLSP